jgi:cell division protein FtsI/penicillin-binding protein 2
VSSRTATLLALGGAVLIALLWWRQSNQPLTYYSSRSYVQRTNDLIRRGALVFDCRKDAIELTNVATEAEKKWFAASYLENDVELFNRNRELFGHFFIVSDCQLREINPFLRTIRLPFAKTTEWVGSIEYSGPGSDASLISANGRTIAVTRAVGDAMPRDARTRIGGTENVSSNAVHLDFAGGFQTPGAEVHSIEGTAVIEQRVKNGQPEDIRLLGNAVGAGRIIKLQSGDWLHLSSTSPVPVSETFLFTGERRYDRLSVIRTRNTRLDRIYTEDDPLLQWVGGNDGKEMLTFGEALARSMTNAIHEVPEPRASKLASEFDIQLSIDRSLQSSLDHILGAYARQLANDTAEGNPFAASVTVMNGKTGEILAAASFPGESDLTTLPGVTADEQRRLLVNHNFKRHPIGSAGKPFFYAAIATRHPFLLDFTVAPHQPEPRRDGGDGEREVLQFFIGRDYKLWPHADARIDMQSALERSCNKFTVELATLALAAPRDLQERTLSQPLDRVFARQPHVVWPRPGKKEDGPQIAGQPIDFPVDLGVYMKDDGQPVSPREDTTAAVTPGSLDRIDEAPFIETLGEITGVRTYGGGAAPHLPAADSGSVVRSAMVTMNYDLRPWSDLVEKLTALEDDRVAWKVRAALQAVSPERVNLSLNQVTNFRTEFISLLLGGSTSQWTNVQLAESLSRLVTKRRVEATMLHAIRPRVAGNPEQPLKLPPTELAVSDEARNTVLHGMQRVILGAHGTAIPMAPRVRELEQRFPGDHIAVFSKTGSPTVNRPESKPTADILAFVVTHGYLFYDKGRLAVSPDQQRVVPYAARGAAGRPQFMDALARASHTAALRTGQPATPQTISRILGYVDRFARNSRELVFASQAAVRLSETAGSPIHVVAGELVLNRDHPIFDAVEHADSSAVYMLSIVKWKGAGDIPTPQDLAANDARVITIVLYLDIGPGSQVAVEAARAMIPEIVRLLE